MDTRGKKTLTKLTEVARLQAKEAQLAEQAEMLQHQRSEFEQEKEHSKRELDKIRIALEEERAENSKQNHTLDIDKTGIGADVQHRQRPITPAITSRSGGALAAYSFCEGLPYRLRSQCRPEHYTCPFAALAFAQETSQRKKLDDLREKAQNPNREQTKERKVYSTGRPLASTPVKFTNHREVLRTPRQNAATKPNKSRMGTPEGSRKICRYCKNEGHEIEECRKRQYNNSRKLQGNAIRPSRTADEPRAGTSREENRPVKIINSEQPEKLKSRS